jgi:hypothetical protein
MKIWSLGQISADERADILGKHRHIYDGYKTMHPEVSNSQPLYVQDFANDKQGFVVNNRGEVKPYTNFGINEQVKKGVCEQCGGVMKESECSECGWMNEGIHDVEDLNNKDKFDYTEEMSEQGGNADDMDVDSVDSAYDFVSDGPMGGSDVYNNEEVDENWVTAARIAAPIVTSYISSKMDETEDEDIIDEIDDDLKESFISQKNKIQEMFNRFKKYN